MLHSIIVVDVKVDGKKNIKRFEEEDKFFHFLSDVQKSDKVEIVGINRYFFGGEIVPQEVIFDKRLQLKPMPVADEKKNEDIFTI